MGNLSIEKALRSFWVRANTIVYVRKHNKDYFRLIAKNIQSSSCKIVKTIQIINKKDYRFKRTINNIVSWIELSVLLVYYELRTHLRVLLIDLFWLWVFVDEIIWENLRLHKQLRKHFGKILIRYILYYRFINYWN